MHCTSNQCGQPVSGKMLLLCERMEKPNKSLPFWWKNVYSGHIPLERPRIVSIEAQLSANHAL